MWLASLFVSSRFGHYSRGYPGPSIGENGQLETERLAAYAANGHAWPCVPWKGWPPQRDTRSESRERASAASEKWVRDLSDAGLRWNEWTRLVQSCVMPRFTSVGFAVVDVKRGIVHRLWAEMRAKYDVAIAQSGVEGLPYESNMRSDMHTPRWIHMHALNQRVHVAMKPLLEEWAGIPLDLGQIYGLRVYTNGSTLVNHIDRTETHVISFIMHIGHDTDAPWPLEIEDHDGVIHAVALEPGEAVYYESAKMLHARMTPLRGRAFASVFGHYMPAQNWNWTKFDVTTAVPPDFNRASSTIPRLRDAAAERPIAQYVRKYWAQRGMATPAYPHTIDNRPIHVFPQPVRTEGDEL